MLDGDLCDDELRHTLQAALLTARPQRTIVDRAPLEAFGRPSTPCAWLLCAEFAPLLIGHTLELDEVHQLTLATRPPGFDLAPGG